ncbi:unnamed protein product [Cuscuta campestris]|uniref:Uncharacterized protein n=2 Tax=Cuscuta sect. Cleistogrammica TaxID=1824901 RepID=A0A484KKX7_9ASTE|nr:unnamed protein product [Cuscuta campestris]
MACFTATTTPLLFCVRRGKAQLIVPETPTPRELKPLSDIDDQGSLRVQVPVLMFYKKSEQMRGKDPGEVVKKGVAKALVLYYPLAGRVLEGQNKKLMVNCNGKGVWFVPAKANVELEKMGFESMRLPCPHLDKLLMNVPGSKGVYDCPIVHIQVTRFTCGGFALAIRFNHTMMDVQGFIQFLNAVSELGQSANEPSITPIWQRELLNARPSPDITSRHREFEESHESKGKRCWRVGIFHGKFVVDVERFLKHLGWLFGNKRIFQTLMLKRSFTFGSRELQALKAQCPSSTTFEALCACLWKCRVVALHPNPKSRVHLTFLVNVRGDRVLRGSNTLPLGYYGNAMVPIAATTTAYMLCSNPISYAAELIREAKRAVNDDYVKSLADLKPKRPVLDNFFVMDTTKIGFDEVDLGWGRPIFGGVVSALYGVGYLVPYKRVEDRKGVVVAVALPPITMGKFQKEIRKAATEFMVEGDGSDSAHHLTVPSGLSPDEFEELKQWVVEFHTYRVNSGQCSSLLAQKIHAPPDAVWSVVRRFDMPQTYKHFIRSCTVGGGFRNAVGDTRHVNVISGLPAATSAERLDLLDDEHRVTGFSIIGGEHRLRNYRSVTSVHGLRPEGTVVLESYVVDMPEGNTEEDTKLFADTVVRLNLQKLASVTEGEG